MKVQLLNTTGRLKFNFEVHSAYWSYYTCKDSQKKSHTFIPINSDMCVVLCRDFGETDPHPPFLSFCIHSSLVMLEMNAITISSHHWKWWSVRHKLQTGRSCRFLFLQSLYFTVLIPNVGIASHTNPKRYT